MRYCHVDNHDSALVLMFGGVAQAHDVLPAPEDAPVPAEIAPIYATDEDLRQVAQDLFDVTLPTAPQSDAIEATRRELGAARFFDPRMSSSGLFSCQSCHNVGIGGVDALPTSIGHG